VASLSIVLFTVLFSLLPSTTKDIENAFLQNNPKILYSLFSSQSSVNISLPEPISFSDQLSHQQAFFLFRKIFSSFITFEFYSENVPPLQSEDNHFIFKARWSFKDNRSDNQYVLHIFFLLVNEKVQTLRNSPLDPWGKNKRENNPWKIIEIKAEKI